MENTTMNKALAELRAKVEAASCAYAKAFNDGAKKKALKPLKTASDDAVRKYNEYLENCTYKQWNAEGDPVKTAIRSHSIPHALKVKFKTDDEDVMTVIISDDADYPVNLVQMSKTLGMGVFAKRDWLTKTEKMVYLIAYRLASEVGMTSFEYQIEEASKEFNFPEDVNIFTDDGCIVALQNIMDSILFIPDEDGNNIIRTAIKRHEDGAWYSREWRVIRERMTKDAGCNAFSICNTTKMALYIMEAMHGVMTNGEFSMSVAEK